MLLASASVVLFMATMYFLMKYLQAGNNIGMIAAALAAVMAATAVFYNLGQVRNAKVPQSTLKRAKRR